MSALVESIAELGEFGADLGVGEFTDLWLEGRDRVDALGVLLDESFVAGADDAVQNRAQDGNVAFGHELFAFVSRPLAVNRERVSVMPLTRSVVEESNDDR